MRHEITSANTKRAIAASLKKSMAQKPLSKITVSEIIADCGINRKTFYYHFEDIYALLRWILDEEAVEVFKRFDLLIEPEEAIAFVIDYVSENQHLLCCAYDSIGREEMKRFFYTDLIDVTRATINSVEAGLGITVDSQFKEMLASFNAEAMGGLLINYFKEGQQYDRDTMIRNLVFILKKSVPNVLKEKALAEGNRQKMDWRNYERITE